MELPIYGHHIDAAYNEAKRLHINKFKSGVTCVNGHQDPDRYTVNKCCVHCSKVNQLKNKRSE